MRLVHRPRTRIVRGEGRRPGAPPDDAERVSAAPGRPGRDRAAFRVVRLGIAAEIEAVLRDFGVVQEDAPRSPRGFASDAAGSPAMDVETLGRLLTECVTRTNCAHFGLLLGQRDTLVSLGLMGALMSPSQTVGVALGNLLNHLHRHDGDAAPTLTEHDGVACLGYAVQGAGVQGADQIADGAVATTLNIMRAMCGPDWSPSEVLLPRSTPTDLEPFTRLFRAPLRFDAGVAALVFPSQCLDRPVVGQTVLGHLFGERLGASEAVAGGSFGDGVRALLRSRLLQSECSAETVARLFAMHRRTLNRHLHEEGLAFNTMVNEVRFEIARRLMANHGMSLTQIAAVLSFSEASAFTRAFRRWSGQTPTAWRAEHPGA